MAKRKGTDNSARGFFKRSNSFAKGAKGREDRFAKTALKKR